MAFTLKSTVRLPGGYRIPLLGLGVYQNYDAKTSVLRALEVGYRHIDSAQGYRNEEAVGQGIAQSNVGREDIFVSEEYFIGSYLQTPSEKELMPLISQRAKSWEEIRDTNRPWNPSIRALRSSDLVRPVHYPH
jgi:hypothetical protein